ncbi:MAG: G4 quadruplex nucleic acid binding protein [Peltula sp. TS41687]|nr:MAG: G4 quadruplex nucleic acid binding protein [Peltula sp. TS41687]
MAAAEKMPGSYGEVSSTSFPNVTYTAAEKAEIEHWTSVGKEAFRAPDVAVEDGDKLRKLNERLSSRTTILGSKPSTADLVLYHFLVKVVDNWSPEHRTGEHGYHHIVRYVDFVQSSPLFGLELPEEQKVKIDVGNVIFFPKAVDPREEKEKRKKEKGAAAGAVMEDKAGNPLQPKGRRSKQVADDKGTESDSVPDSKALGDTPLPHRPKAEKQPKAAKRAPQKGSQQATVLSPSLIDLRVGHILKAVNHPNADSLYVSTIACGDAPDTENTSSHEGQAVRTVCSGLNGLVPLEEMQDRKVIVVCNLKPVTMRGIKSAAMVLAASGKDDDHKGPVELVLPPAGAKPGERVWFEGWKGEPELVLNPKKKVWETIQPGFTTTDDLEVGFDVKAVPQLTGDGTAEGNKTAVARLKTESGGTSEGGSSPETNMGLQFQHVLMQIACFFWDARAANSEP